MNSFEQVSQQCRHLKLASLVQELPELLQQAEANEMSYLQYTEALLGHEVKQRNSKRIAMNRRKAGFPMEETRGQVLQSSISAFCFFDCTTHC